MPKIKVKGQTVQKLERPRTDRRTDGRYQTYNLPCFAVDKNSLLWKIIEVLEFPTYCLECVKSLYLSNLPWHHIWTDTHSFLWIIAVFLHSLQLHPIYFISNILYFGWCLQLIHILQIICFIIPKSMTSCLEKAWCVKIVGLGSVFIDLEDLIFNAPSQMAYYCPSEFITQGVSCKISHGPLSVYYWSFHNTSMWINGCLSVLGPSKVYVTVS